MKLAMNGALTLATIDGANIEIIEEVGEPNIYTFGLTPEEVRWYREQHSYNPRELYNQDPLLHRVMDSLAGNRFCPDEQGLFRWIVDEILDRGDRYFHMADLPSYIDASHRAEKDYQDTSTWARKAILNVARTGKFSSDRTVREYAREIWKVKPADSTPEQLDLPAKEPARAEVSR
jgi:starch phosphorylase